jgi:hypothetical protein
MLLPSTAPASPDDSARRSQRKTKRIDRDRFAKAYVKPRTAKRSKLTASDDIFHSELHSYCSSLMAVSTCSHEEFLLAEMARAFREQSGKLLDICKIKLKLDEQLPPSLVVPVSPQTPVCSMEELPEEDSS